MIYLFCFFSNSREIHLCYIKKYVQFYFIQFLRSAISFVLLWFSFYNICIVRKCLLLCVPPDVKSSLIYVNESKQLFVVKALQHVLG